MLEVTQYEQEQSTSKREAEVKVERALYRYRYTGKEWRYTLAGKDSLVYGLMKSSGGRYTGMSGNYDEYELLCDDQPTEVLLTMLELTKNGEAK